MPIPFYWVNKELDPRLVARFTLSINPLLPDPMQILRQIVPVTIMDELVKVPKAGTSTHDLTGTAGTFQTAFTVGKGKRWTVNWIQRGATTANSAIRITIGGVDLSPADAGTAAERHSETWYMDQDDTIKIMQTGNAGDGSRTIQIHYIEEDSHKLG